MQHIKMSKQNIPVLCYGTNSKHNLSVSARALWNVRMLIICFHSFQVQENFLEPYTYHNIKLLFIRVWLQYCIFFWKEKKSISTFLIHSVHFDIQSFSIHNHDEVFEYKRFKDMRVLMRLRLKPPSQNSCSNIHFSKTKCQG